MNSKGMIIWFAMAIYYPLSAQNWQLEKKIILKESITSCDIDPEARIYVGTSNGNVYRYDANGVESEAYSAISNFPVTMINAWNRFKVFLFYQSSQQFHFLDRFNATPQSYELTEYQTHWATLSAPGTDNSVWILSTKNNELKKFNIQSKQELISNPLTVDLGSASYMRAYQNLLIIADPENGIYQFDRFGNLQNHLNEKGVSYFQIENKKLIYLLDDQIIFRDIYSPQANEKIKAPKRGLYQVVKSGDRFFFVGKQSLSIYSVSR